MSDIHPYFLLASSRRRAELNSLFDECAVIRDLHQSIADFKEWPRVLQSIHANETILPQIEALPKTPIANDVDKITTAADERRAAWVHSFLKVIVSYANETTTYQDVINKFNLYRTEKIESHSEKNLPPNLKARLHSQQGPLEVILKDLEAGGYPPSLLGEMEAHWQIRRIAQVYFGLYSSEIQITGTSRKQNTIDASIPDLPYYSRRHNQRSRLMRKVESRKADLQDADETIFLIHYLDRLHSSRAQLRVWHDSSRELYEQKILLMRGFFGIKDYLSYIRTRYGSAQKALQRIPEDAYLFYFELSAQEKIEAAAENQAQISLIQSFSDSTLCLARSIGTKRKYAGIYNGIGRTIPDLFPLLNLHVARDIFQDHELKLIAEPIRQTWALGKKLTTRSPKDKPKAPVSIRTKPSKPSAINPAAETEKQRVERLAENRRLRLLAREQAKLLTPNELIKLALENQRRMEEAKKFSKEQKLEKAKKSLKAASRQTTIPKRRKPLRNKKNVTTKDFPLDKK